MVIQYVFTGGDYLYGANLLVDRYNFSLSVDVATDKEK